MKRIAFIINGKIRFKRLLLARIKKEFSAHTTEFYTTKIAANGIVLSSKAIKESYVYIISVGGDGTLNEVVNGIMANESLLDKDAFSRLRLGVLPYGSGNDFAKTIKTEFDLRNLRQAIESDEHTTIDLGLVSFKNLQGENAIRHFINITDVGIGGIVARRVNGTPKWLGSFLAYQWAIIRSLILYKHQSINAITDSTIYTGKILNYIIANGKYFGSGLCIAPDAKPDDGVFALVIVGKVSLGFYLKSLSNIKKGKHIKHPEVFYQQSTTVRIDSKELLPIDMDGEYIGTTPMEVKLMSGVLKLLLPK